MSDELGNNIGNNVESRSREERLAKCLAKSEEIYWLCALVICPMQGCFDTAHPAFDAVLRVDCTYKTWHQPRTRQLFGEIADMATNGFPAGLNFFARADAINRLSRKMARHYFFKRRVARRRRLWRRKRTWIRNPETGQRESALPIVLGRLAHDRRLRGDPYNSQRPSLLERSGGEDRPAAPLHPRFVRCDLAKFTIIYPDLRLECKVATHPRPRLAVSLSFKTKS